MDIVLGVSSLKRYGRHYAKSGASSAKAKVLPGFKASVKGNFPERMADFYRQMIQGHLGRQREAVINDPVFRGLLARAYSKVRSGSYGYCDCGVSMSMAALVANPLLEKCPACVRQEFLARYQPLIDLLGHKKAEIGNELALLKGKCGRLLLDSANGASSPDVIDQAQAREESDLCVAGLRAEDKRRQLEAIEAALDRIDAGTYGICEECEEEIPLGRLKIVPFARTCVKCIGH